VRFAWLMTFAWMVPIAAAAATASPTPPASIEVGRYHLQSNPWVNLHQRIVCEIRCGAAPPVALRDDSLAAWKRAVDGYRAFIGSRSPIEDDELMGIDDALSRTTGDGVPVDLPAPTRAVLSATMPLYRATQWPADDRTNRFWMAMVKPLLEYAAEDLIARHERVYGRPFPRWIRVDVSPFAWLYGGYTVGPPDSAHTVMSSTEPGYRGYAALEMLMHEPSHVIVGDHSGAIGRELGQASRELGIRPYASLWHAILFYTSGELTRQLLAECGVGDYAPTILGMYERGYRGYRQALETHWQAYLEGRTSRTEAIRQILIETAPPKKSP